MKLGDFFMEWHILYIHIALHTSAGFDLKCTSVYLHLENIALLSKRCCISSVSHSTRSHNILFKECHALWRTTIVRKSNIEIIRGFLFEMGLSLLFKCLTCLFCMLAYSQGPFTSNIGLLSRILAEQRHVLVCTGISLQQCGTKNHDCKQTLPLLVLVANAHARNMMDNASFTIYGIYLHLG